MYFKFCRYYKADEKAPGKAETNLTGERNDLSVELKEKPDSQILNVRVYRIVCFILSIICLALLLGIIILYVKYPTVSLVCPEQEKYVPGQAVGKESPLVCSLQQCKAKYPQFKIKEPKCQVCDEGWQGFENVCYYLSQERLNWEDSQKYCQATGGDLAVITNDRVQDFLTQKGNLLYWIGLRYTAQQWTWVTSAVLGKSYWSRDVQGGECGLLVGQYPANHSWTASPCSYVSAYICQTKPKLTLLPAAQG